ncbi:glycosyltransferase [Gracilibacillus sp. S3-1-1]|uniref:Glycosyltransferase n=1 Tax=Gracilibacillus pellucidus TaxID=3095368 RepID=A0ACC6M0N9_9BACI|nr:glycosyltransferase [Gracilibacillus sp. S3-1-1]MDX8044505.1 glycosyltransferase [Gracilibacillus sp. S3-1-1]
MRSALRVLHVVSNMNNSETSTKIMNVYRHLDRKEVQFDFLVTAEGDYDKEIKQLGGHLFKIPSIECVGMIKYKRSLRQFFKGHRFYIIVHSHIDQMSYFPLREAKRVGIPIRVAQNHHVNEENSNWWKEIVARMIPFYANHYIASSDMEAESLFRWKAKNLEMMFKSIEAEHFHYSISLREQGRKELGISDDYFVVGHIGSLISKKNYTYLIELFVGFRRKYPKSTLVLVGDEDVKVRLKEKIAQFHLQDHVIMLNNKNVHKWIQVFDLAVFPSLLHGFPLSLIEAQGAGLPVLVSDTATRKIDLGTGLVQFIPLTNKRRWLEAMYEAYVERKREPVDWGILEEKGYGLNDVVKQTEQKYLQLRDDGI